MPILTRFKKLKELNLHGNRLKQLPEDLSALRSLESLDLSNNLFVNINSVITALQSLPNLVSLSYPLSSKEEENLLTLGLPKLKYLNNKELSNKAVEVEQQ
jgi:Leucine-rich repeat (LRR) protein